MAESTYNLRLILAAVLKTDFRGQGRQRDKSGGIFNDPSAGRWYLAVDVVRNHGEFEDRDNGSQG